MAITARRVRRTTVVSATVLRAASAALDELQAIAERVEGVEASVPRELRVVDGLDTRIPEAVAELVDPVHQERRMGLAGWAEVLLHAEVDLHARSPKPRAATGFELRRLGCALQSEQSRVEPLSG
jgi:hypothetical protein